MTQLPTGRGLLVAEKSSFMKTVQAVYRKHAGELPYTLDFDCFAGHVVELPMPEGFNPDWGGTWSLDKLPMIPVEWRYERSKLEGKGKRYDSVANALKSGKYDFIINAGDPEREGQLIQDAFFDTLPEPYKSLPRYRMWYNDEKDETLVHSLKSLLAPDDHIPNAGTVRNLSEASFLRARFDWLLGLNATQALSVKSHAKVTVGRVQTPILKILVDRELAIRNFKVEPFWAVRIYFEHQNGVYIGTLIGEDGKPVQFFDKRDAEAAVAKFDPSATGMIKDKKVRLVKENPPRFYSLAKLQGDAARIYGITMGDSLSTLQWLYEQKILSYPRTDSQFITEAMTPDIPAIFKSAQEAPQLKKFPMPTADEFAAFAKNKNHVNDAEARAHTALMPLSNVLLDFNKMTETQQNIYYLVARSVILPFLGSIEKEKTELITEFSGMLFKTTGSVIKTEGWMAATPEYNSKDQVIPDVEINDSVGVERHEIKEGKTTPPKRFTPETMLNALENIHTLLETDEAKIAMKRAEGLGRPSTRTAILEGLEKHELISCTGKKQEYGATNFGIDVINELGSAQITSPQLTATWETKLQDLEDGLITAPALYAEMVQYTKDTIDELKSIRFTLKHAPASKEKAVIATLLNGNEILEAKTGFYDKDFLAWMDANKKAQDAGQPAPEFNGFWVKKTWETKAFKMTGHFTRKDIKALADGQTIEKEFTWLGNNSKSMAKLELNNQLQLAFVKRASNQQVEDPFTLGLYQIQRVHGTKADGTSYDLYRFLEPEFVIGRTIGGYDITREDLASLVNGETIERTITSKAGKPFQANLTLVIGKGLNMEPVRSSGKKVSDNITQYEKDGRVYYQLSNGAYVQSTIAGHTVTIAELELLATRGEIYAEDFVSKKGNYFSARLIVEGRDVKFAFD